MDTAPIADQSETGLRRWLAERLAELERGLRERERELETLAEQLRAVRARHG